MTLSLTRRIFYLVMILIGIPAIIVISLELGGRMYLHFKYGMPGKSYGVWRYDEELGAIQSENAYNTNSETNNYGFRNVEDVLDPKPEGSYRVIAYGGSTTYCYNLSNTDAWPSQLQHLLRDAHHYKDQVLNGGAILWSLSHAYARAQRDLPILRADFVIIYSGINEETNANALRLDGKDVTEGQVGLFAKNLDQNRWLKRNSVIVRFLDYYITPNIKLFLLNENKNSANDENIYREIDEAVYQNYLRVLERFIQLIKSHGEVPIFVIQAHGRNNVLNERLTGYSRRAASSARAFGARVIDAQTVVDGYEGDPMDLFISSGVHWSSRGAAMLAKLIYEHGFNFNDANGHRD